MIGDTTIRAKLYTSKLLANGENPIVLVVTQNRKRTHRSIGLSCDIKYWNLKKEEPKHNHPQGQLIQQLIQKRISELRQKLLEYKVHDRAVSPERLFEVTKLVPANCDLFDFTEEIIQNLITAKRIGNADAYKDMLRTLKRFIPLRKTLLFDEVDVAFLNKLETDLRSRGLAETTISIVFRTLRAVFNKAREEERIPMTTYPFMKFKISKFNTQTKKRALKKEEVLMILSYDASKSKKLQLSKDIFIFSYLCQGINFIDIAYLKWSDVADNRVVYRRAKTGSDFSVGLKPASEEIINRYRAETCQRATDYIFPILDKHVHITEQQQTYRIQKLLAQVNKNLKLIGKEIGLNIPLTTYVARHSYATVLKMSGIPTAQISEALGHKSEAITQTYLKSFENSVIDLANEVLL